MNEMQEEDLFALSDEELEAAFKRDKAAEASPETDYEQEESTDEIEQEEDFNESEDVQEDDTLELDDNELNDGPEHLDEGSDDHDASDESDADTESDEDAEEATESNPDGDSDVDDAEPTDDEEEEEDKPQQVQEYKFKANGQEYSFTEDEIKEQFPRVFGQAMDYTKKMQAIKPWRKTIDAMEQAELKHDDINLMIDVLKGDKEAVSEVLKRTGVDALDLDTENSNYVAKDYGRDESALAINDVIDRISTDNEFAVTKNVLANQWDDQSWNAMAQDPNKIELLHVDVKSGMFDTINPIANKLKVYDGGTKSDLDYYIEASQQYFSQLEQQKTVEANREQQEAQRKAEMEAKQAEKARLNEIKAKQAQRSATKQASQKRKAAAPTKTNAGNSKVVDYLDASDEEFEDWYKRTMDV